MPAVASPPPRVSRSSGGSLWGAATAWTILREQVILPALPRRSMTPSHSLQLVLAALAVLFAFGARGVSGFGSGMIAVPLLAILFPLTRVVPAVAVLNYLAALWIGFKDFRRAAWRELGLLLPAALAGLALALPIFHALSPILLRRLLGGWLLLQAARSLARAPPRAASRGWALPAGLLGGITDGLFSIGGPVYAAYLGRRELEKSAFRATLTMLLVLESSLRLIGYGATGILDRSAIGFAAALLPVAFLGLLLGERLHGRLPEQLFRRIVSLLILASGLVLLAT